MGSVCFGKLIEITNLVSNIGHTMQKTVFEIGYKVKDHQFVWNNTNLLIMIQTNGEMIWYVLTCYQMQYLSTKNKGFETAQAMSLIGNNEHHNYVNQFTLTKFINLIYWFSIRSNQQNEILAECISKTTSPRAILLTLDATLQRLHFPAL